MRKIHKQFLAALALAAPVAARAAEAGAEWSPFQGNFGNFLWTLITLLVVYLVLKKWAWKPLLDGLQARERFIEDSLHEATVKRDQAEALLREHEAKLAATRDEIEAMLDEARRDAAVLKEREEAKAREESKAIIGRARREIDIATDTAVKRLYEEAAELATVAAGRILDREITAADHDKLVAEAIETLRTGKGAGETPRTH